MADDLTLARLERRARQLLAAAETLRQQCEELADAIAEMRERDDDE